MAKSKGKNKDALESLRRRFPEGHDERAALARQVRHNAGVAPSRYDLRTRAKLSQRQLADLVGTTASVICRLEDADYEGHSLNMLHRIAAALGNRVEVRFVPVKGFASRKGGAKASARGKQRTSGG